MPNTWAFARLSCASESRNVQSSLVHTELNAAGKNASTTGRPRNALSVTGWRSSLIKVKSGAFDPTSTDMTVLPGGPQRSAYYLFFHGSDSIFGWRPGTGASLTHSACGPRGDSESSSAAARASGGGAPRA